MSCSELNPVHSSLVRKYLLFSEGGLSLDLFYKGNTPYMKEYKQPVCLHKKYH